MMPVYLDYAATAPLFPEARQAMEPYLAAGLENLAFGANANTLYGIGRDAFAAMEDARRSVARHLGRGRGDEIIFTSCATESNALALMGIAAAQAQKRHLVLHSSKSPHIIIGPTEHASIENCAQALRQQGFAVSRLTCNAEGTVSPQQLADALTPQTVLVSIQLANGEIGTVQDIPALCHAAHRGQALFHTDATQGLGHIPLNAPAWDVDAMSVSGHKIGAPKGIGALYLKARTPFEPLWRGGGQEGGRRGGTQHVCAYAAFAAALEYAAVHQQEEYDRQLALRVAAAHLMQEIPGVRLTLDYGNECAALLPQTVHVTVNRFESETLIMRLDREGYCVSGGSACSSGSLKASSVLTAIGMDSDRALGALRISFGRYTTLAELEGFAQALRRVIVQEK